MEQIDIRLCNFHDSNEVESLLTLLHETYPKATKFSEEYKKWQCLDNPNGEAVAFNAYCGSMMVAHYCTIPLLMKIGGEIHKGLLSLDTSTHPDYRGKGLFPKLAECTYKYARESGYDFVIGVANANSTSGFLKKLGFYLISPLEVKIGIGRDFCGPTTLQNHVFYNQETLNWRLQCPAFKYSRKNETVFGCIGIPFINTVVGYVGRNVNYSELKQPNGFVNLYVGMGQSLKKSYYNLPKFIKRSPFNLIFKDLTDGDLPVLSKDNVFFQLMDFDVA